MREILAISLIGCATPGAPTTGTGTTSQPTQTPSSDSGSTVGTDPVLERVYEGTLHLDVADNGILFRKGACDAPLTLTVDPTAEPQVLGTAECTLAGDLSGNTLAITFTADDSSAPALVGEATGTYSGAPDPVAGTWESTLVVTQDGMMLEGSSEGSWVGGADLGFSWNGTFNATSP